ncbi:hypothetical protein GCM10011390_03310 [Aureimonas endophytica]|uniref:Uncharacterized protein n=1 Tax=Aureimonas endophytica TaxID=2027858 RepID=A0A917E128_9HYPH|nr:hypothetical protein [Aureimonas endophytica]GGD87887.1 hypothetical protein GCM10011390_03310 [Aureimonas endophytica]
MSAIAAAKPSRADRIAAECAAIAASGVCVASHELRAGDHVRLIVCDDPDFNVGAYCRVVTVFEGEHPPINVAAAKKYGDPLRNVMTNRWTGVPTRMLHSRPGNRFQIISRKE